MSNKQIGNEFESELCELLSAYGFWVHNMAQNASGQPADVIAVRNGQAYLIDCKVCSTDKGFDMRRVEENQELSMTLWKDCGNHQGWFAFKLPTGDIFLLPHVVVKAMSYTNKYLSPADIFEMGKPLEKWVGKCR